jgi:hypothetical protein
VKKVAKKAPTKKSEQAKELLKARKKYDPRKAAAKDAKNKQRDRSVSASKVIV